MGETRQPDWPPGLYQAVYPGQKAKPQAHYFWRRQINGTRERIALGETRLAAENRARFINESLDEGKSVEEVRRAILPTGGDFREAANRYLSRDRAPKTVARYRAMIDNFERIATDILGRPMIRLTEINQDLVDEFATRRRTEEVSPNGHANTAKQKGAGTKTIHEEVLRVIAVLKDAVDRDDLKEMPRIKNPVSSPAKKGQQSAIARPLDEGELKRVLDAARDYDKAQGDKWPYPSFWHDIIACYVYAGLRKDELRHLEWTDVDFANNWLRIQAKPRITNNRRVPVGAARDFLEQATCGKKPNAHVATREQDLETLGNLLRFKQAHILEALRVRDVDLEEGIVRLNETYSWKPKASQGNVPLHPYLRSVLEALKPLATSNFVFPHQDGGNWRVKVEEHVQRIYELAKLSQHHRLHDLRHTFGALLRRAGVRLEDIKEVMRHANIQETLVYARYDDKDGQAAVRRLPAWE